jgi:hypothetical protein
MFIVLFSFLQTQAQVALPMPLSACAGCQGLRHIIEQYLHHPSRNSTYPDVPPLINRIRIIELFTGAVAQEFHRCTLGEPSPNKLFLIPMYRVFDKANILSICDHLSFLMFVGRRRTAMAVLPLSFLERLFSKTMPHKEIVRLFHGLTTSFPQVLVELLQTLLASTMSFMSHSSLATGSGLQV